MTPSTPRAVYLSLAADIQHRCFRTARTHMPHCTGTCGPNRSPKALHGSCSSVSVVKHLQCTNAASMNFSILFCACRFDLVEEMSSYLGGGRAAQQVRTCMNMHTSPQAQQKAIRTAKMHMETAHRTKLHCASCSLTGDAYCNWTAQGIKSLAKIQQKNKLSLSELHGRPRRC